MKIKMIFINFLIINCLASNYCLEAQSQTALSLFKKYLVGNFENWQQVKSEKMAGKQIHPYTRRINRVFDQNIKNFPSNFQGFLVLEETFYLNPQPSDTLFESQLFKIESIDNQTIRVYLMLLPTEWEKKNISTNTSQEEIDFQHLQISPTFKNGIIYTLKEGQVFYTQTIIQLSVETRFTLEAYLSKSLLSVREVIEKNGQNLRTYDTPILYDRVKRFAR